MNDPHRRLAAALEDRYLIERELGEGGMATVFLARDLKHNRPVALKVLKPELAAVVGAERFLAEIETTANLQHPHILPLFDSGEADGFLFYVMPFVEGETVADRLARERQLPVGEAVSIARAVAEALETAHEAGVIHRDVKPGNILLSRGQPLVSDFGIALAVGAGGARLTETGLSVGTPYYMSPEQATGDQPVGPGADVYALGCVLYEMLVGEPPYVGNTAQAVLGKIIQGLPVSPTAVRKTVPAHVDAAIRKALERLPADRFTRAADFARALADPGFRHGEPGGVAAGPAGSGWRGWAWPAVAVLAAAAAVVGWIQRPAATDDGPVERFRIQIPGYIPNSPMSFGAVAPDGSAFAFLGWDQDRRLRVFLKDAGDLDATVVEGLQPDDAGALAFSPDGNWLAVASFDGRLLKVARSGGGVSEQAEVSANVVVWPEDGAIAVGGAGWIVRVAVDGGVLDTIPLSAPEAEVRQMTPLPDDRGFLFVQVPADAAPELWAFDARAGETRLVREGVVGAWYGDPGILVLAESGPGRALEISAVGFDLGSLQVAGVPVGIGEAVASFVGSPEMWLSPGGTLVYAPRGRSVGRSELVWVDRTGEVQSVDPEFRFGFLNNGGQRLSPDGSRVALARYEQDGESEARWDVVVKRLPDFPATSVAAVDGPKRRPAWHPDGTTLVYIGEGGSRYLDLWETRADGTGTPRRIFDEGRAIFEGLWSPDGEWIVYRTDDETEVEGRGDIMGFRPGLDTVAVPLIATPAEETSPAISPDGRWIAYASSDEGGTKNIFVKPFPDVDDGLWQISSTGGTEPAWSREGTEIFFWSSPGPGGEMRVARIDTDDGFALESVETLFPTPAGVLKDDDNRLYDVHPDGERFLMVRTVTPPEDGLVYVSDFFEVAREALGG